MINSLDILSYVAKVDCSKCTGKIYIDMNSSAIRSVIRLFSFRPAYFVSETKEGIHTYMYDIWFRYPTIRIHIRLSSFRPVYFVSETKEEINTYLDDI